jgi:phosphoribosyl-ATP pyrophosphohydrolase
MSDRLNGLHDMTKAPNPSADTLAALWNTVQSRRGADPKGSYSAALLARYPIKPAQKLAEEASECVIEAVAGRPEGLVRESADMLYHLVVLLVGAGISAEAVFSELASRERSSSMASKRRQSTTTKIP